MEISRAQSKRHVPNTHSHGGSRVKFDMRTRGLHEARFHRHGFYAGLPLCQKSSHSKSGARKEFSAVILFIEHVRRFARTIKPEQERWTKAGVIGVFVTAPPRRSEFAVPPTSLPLSLLLQLRPNATNPSPGFRSAYKFASKPMRVIITMLYCGPVAVAT
jgi:hypothetical protein